MEEQLPAPESPPEKDKKERGIYKIGRWTVRVLFGLLVFFLLLSALLQVPAVQTRVARFVTAQLSDYLGTRVSIQRIGIAFFDRVVLEGFYVEDPECDTLFTCERLTAGINSNIITLIKSGLELDELSVRNAALYVNRPQGAPRSNLDWLLDHFARKDPQKERDPFRLQLKRLYLENVTYRVADDVKGSHMHVHIPQGLLRIREMNLPEKILHIDQFVLDKPELHIESRTAFPLPQALPSALRRTPKDSDTLTWEITLKDLDLTRGAFSVHNLRKAPQKITPADQLDFNHLDLSGIQIRLKKIQFNADTLSGVIDKIAAQSSSGFNLQQLAVKEAVLSSKRITLNGLDLQTPQSRLGDTLAFSFENYGAFADFTSSVGMDARFHNAYLAVQDLLTFAPGLAKNAFFQNNKNETFQIQGRVRGTVNDLSGRGLEIALGKGAFLRGRLDLRDVTIPGQGYFGVDLQEARTTMRVLQQIIPRFNLPPNFDRLGRLQFSGAINGFFATGFTIYGNMRSDLGIADLDMTLNPNGGRERATYSGRLTLQNFDLGTWTQNPDFGKVSLTASVQKGRSFVAATASAELSAELRSFSYKKYEYKNAAVSGSLNRNFFNGDFAIQDENVDFTFNGRLDFSKDIPVFNFKAALKKLDLKELNLSKKDIILAGNVELNIRNSKLSNAEGAAHITDLHITLDQDETFSVDKVDVFSEFTGPENRLLRLHSDVMRAEVKGNFEIEKLPATFLQHLYKNHAGFAQRLKIKPPKRNINPAHFEFQLDILDSKGFNHLLSPKLYQLQDVTVKGAYNEAFSLLEITASTQVFQFGDLRLENPFLEWKARDGVASLDAGTDKVLLNQKNFLGNPLLLNGLIYKDSLLFGLTYASAGAKVLENLHLDGVLAAVDSNAFSLHFEQSNLTLMNRLWLIHPENRVVFSKDAVRISNLILTHDNYRIGLENFGKKGARVALMNFDFHLIDKYWDYPQLEFAGPFNILAWVEDATKMEGLNLALIANTMMINNDDWGSLRLEASAPNLRSRISAIFSLENDSAQIWGRGFYNLQDIKGRGNSRNFDENRKKYFLANFNLSGVPLRTIEYFLPGIITGTQGHINGDLTISGLGAPQVEGSLLVNQGMFTIDFLKTTYRFDQAIVRMNDSWLFDASGARVRDKFGHTATITGGIRHSRLKDLRIDAVLNTSRLLALDTKKGDNKQFYGQAIGSGYARFSGPLDRIDAYIKGTVNDSTRLVIPISSEREAQSINYVNFIERRSKPTLESSGTPPPSPKGMNIEMDLTIGREAVMQLIFDEQAGDILEGNGRGNIRILLPRNGDFQMFGDYDIEAGDYLFTLYGVINKKFQVLRGGSIKWSGDPYKAIIRLDAEYTGINTPVAVFIADFIAGERPQVKSEASKATQVNLVLHLIGELFQPQINFDIEFPLLTGELKNYTDSKLRILKQDPNELNRQAFGLIVAGQFLPSDLNNVQAPDVIYNTVSELVSNQLSLLLTDLFSEFIDDGRVLSGIDFQVAYSQYRPGDDPQRNYGRGEEFEVRLRQSLFNDRLTVLVGGNYDTGGRIPATPGTTGGAFFGNDVVIEYAISADRSLTLKVYQRLQPDIGGRRLKIGAGLSFRKEYESFGDFVRSIRLAGRKGKANNDS